MTKLLKVLLTIGLFAFTAALMAGSLAERRLSTAKQNFGWFASNGTQVHTVGSDQAIIFYFDDDRGKRVVVTTIGSMDPQRSNPGTQVKITLNEGDRYHAAIANSHSFVQLMNVRFGVDGLAEAH